MINASIFERKEHTKTNQIMTGLKCAICGEPVPDKMWSDLANSQNDYCEKHKHARVKDADDIIMACIKSGKAYWRPVAAKPCRAKGINNCITDCPFEDCVLKNKSLYL